MGSYTRRAFRVVLAAGKSTGVQWVGLHTLRYTTAAILLRRGWNAVRVQFLGHHSPAFTLASCVHFLDDDLPSADFFDSLGRQAERVETMGDQRDEQPKPEVGGEARLVGAITGLAVAGSSAENAR